MNEEVRIKNEETGTGRLVPAMCGGWSAARNTAVVRGHGFGATREAGGPENGEKAPVQGVEDQGFLGLVGLCWTFQFKKFWRGGVGWICGWLDGKAFSDAVAYRGRSGDWKVARTGGPESRPYMGTEVR